MRYPALGNGPASRIFWVIADRVGGLRVASEAGIFRASRQQSIDHGRGNAAAVRWLDVGRSGQVPHLQSNPIAQPAVCQTPDGLLWFATVKGVIVLDPRRLRLNDLPPQVRVEHLLVDGALVAWAGAQLGGGGEPAATPTVIGPGHRRFEFQYLLFSCPRHAKLAVYERRLDAACLFDGNIVDMSFH